MAQLSDATNFCTFCYKSISIEQNKHTNSIVNKFTKLLSRFLNEKDENFETIISSLPSSTLSCCKDCENLISSFCKVYHGIKCLELKLLLKLDTLGNVMKSADKVTSRVKYLQQYFHTDKDKRNVISKSTEKLENFLTFRTEIMKNCDHSRRLPHIQPQVLLHKLNQGIVTTNIHCKSEYTSVTPEPEAIQSFDQQIFTEWLISFAALVSLVHSDNCDALAGDCGYTNTLIMGDNEDDNDVLISNDELVYSTDKIVDDCGIASNDRIFSNVIAAEETDLLDDLMSIYDETVHMESPIVGKTCCTTSKGNNVRVIDRQEVQEETTTVTETSTIIPSNKAIQKFRPFPCSQCKMTFLYDRSLKNHMRRRHRGFRPPRNRDIEQSENFRFRCGLCKTSHKSYDRLRIRKYSAFHQYLERKALAKIKVELSEQVSRSTSNEVEKDSYSNREQDITKENSELHKESNTKRYNLRLNKQQSYVTNNEDNEDLKEDKDYSEENCSSLSSSSSEADNLEDDQISTSSISSHDEVDEIEDNNRRFYYCTLDDCTYRVPNFTNKLKLDEHQKLHKKGEYRCNFCDKVEDTVIRLGLHESKMHSRFILASTSSHISTSEFKCARCSYESKMERVFINHFASVHLGIYDLNAGKVKKEMWQCEICKVKFKMTNNISKKSELHFQSHHDTNGLDNPHKQTKKCGIDECKAYFLSCEQLRLHRERQHSSSNLQSRKRKLDSDNDVNLEDLEMESLKCSLCTKTFTSLRYLLQHKQTFHVTKPMILPKEELENNNENKPSWKRIVCPEIKCTKSFLTKKALEVHKSLHGKFSCEFCEIEKDYAFDLAYHEYENHCVIIKAEDQEAVQKHQTKKKTYKCPRCPKILLNKLAYLRHFVNGHLGLSTVHAVCSICKYASRDESLRRHNLDSHYTVDMDQSKISKCNLCPAYFRKETQLIRHVRNIHSNEDIDDETSNVHVGHKCKQCNRIFRTNTSLKFHHTYAHSGKPNKKVKRPFHCVLDKCKRRFSNNTSLDRHQKLHERGSYPCQFCDKNLNTILKLCKHEVGKHQSQNSADVEGKVFQCSRCSYNNKSESLLQNHFATTHLNIYLRSKPKKNDKQPVELKCAICGLELDSAPELATHEALHNNKSTKRTKCSRCTGTFRQNSYVNHFIRKHFSGQIKRKHKICTICQTSVARLDNHYRNCHKTDNLKDPSKIYKCEENQCKAYFLKGEQLIRHKLKMHKSIDTTCKECGKKMKTITTLQNHMKQFHSFLDEKLPLECDVPNCKKRFNIGAELEWHKKYDRHQKSSSEKFTCEKCGKVFAAKNRLQIHLLSIHPNRLFICPECGKSFKTKGGLDVHLEYHKSPDEWKFECDTCGKKCVTKYLLKDHIKTHTKEKPFVCQYCGEKYAHQHNWKNHMLTKHKTEDNLPGTIKIQRSNHISRKGTKKGDCVIAGVKQ